MSPFIAFISLPNGPELILILLVVLLLFGAKKLPELARGLGQSMKEFKRGKGDFDRASDSTPKPETTEPKAPVAEDQTPRADG
jgi:sec-independent protein translocase protein TatA